MTTSFSPPLTDAPQLTEALRGRGFAVLSASTVSALTHASPTELQALAPHWADLPRDVHLKDGGHYRRRRHGSFIVTAETVTAVPHRAHYQPLAYNALHGGIERWFDPLANEMVIAPAWSKLLRALGTTAAALRGAQTFFAEAHPFRIETEGGIGRPTPEGAHRDGVDLVCVMFVTRHNIKGGETRVFDANGPSGIRFTLSEPWSALLLDDAQVIHETTPIQALDTTAIGYRDTLVITLRAGGFQAS